jgi:L-amino acid N-acyltransferase YncA
MAARIRLAGVHDAQAIAGIYRPFVERTVISFETEPPTREEMEHRISETMASHPWLVCEIGEQVAGYAYATRHRARAAYQWSVDTSVYVGENHWRLGIGRALYASLFPILAVQGFCNAFAGIALPNPGSVGLHESVGFTPIGVYERVGYKLGAWRDVGWWQRPLTALETPPEQPLTLKAVQSRPDWTSLLAIGESIVRV